MRRLTIVPILAASLALPAFAQTPAAPAATAIAKDSPAPAAPALTDVQKLTVQNLAQQIEIAQLRAQQAQRDFDQAREQLGKLLQSLQVDGYDLDLRALTYSKKPEPKKEPEKK